MNQTLGKGRAIRVALALAFASATGACNAVLGIYELGGEGPGDGGQDSLGPPDVGIEAGEDGTDGADSADAPNDVDGTIALDATDATRDSVATTDVSDANAASDSSDADAEAAPDATCTSRTAVVGGTGTSTSLLYTAIIEGVGAPMVATSNGVSMSAPAAVVALPGRQFHAIVPVVAGNNEQYFLTNAPSTGWSPTGVAGNMSSLDTPSLVYANATLYSLYLGTDNDYYLGYFAQPEAGTAGWLLGPSPNVGAGSAAPVGMASGSTLLSILTVGGGPEMLAYQTLLPFATSWSSTSPIGAGATARGTTPPAIVPLTGGANDALLVYADSNSHINFMTRARSTGMWSGAAEIKAPASYYTTVRPSLAPLANGTAMLVYLDTTSGSPVPSWSLFDSTQPTQLWTTPAPLVTPAPLLALAPSVAQGVCGDDAVAVYPTFNDAQLVHFRGGQWGPPTELAQFSEAQYATVATAP